MKKIFLILLSISIVSCSKKETSKEEIFNFLNQNPDVLKEYLVLRSQNNPQKRLLNLSLKEVNEAKNKNLPFDFKQEDMLFLGNKAIIGLETSLDCPVICKNNFNEVKKFALKNDVGIGLILTQSKNSQLEKFTLSAMELYPEKKVLILETVINNPKEKLEQLSKKATINHQKVKDNMKNITTSLKKSSDTPLIYMNTLTIKGIYRQESLSEVFNILY